MKSNPSATELYYNKLIINYITMKTDKNHVVPIIMMIVLFGMISL